MAEVHKIKLFLVSIGETYGTEDDDLPELHKELARGALSKSTAEAGPAKAASARASADGGAEDYATLSPRGPLAEPSSESAEPGPGEDDRTSLDSLEDAVESEVLTSPRAPLADSEDGSAKGPRG